ncbi:Ger(x)C family spore germination protein [Clostridium sp. 'White wine YQ']|uniref:Ger(x)C family spore germination protein n=1 Tax=Clostridium sp. 'White wine YQ' TaxID=3027474 RepID=UPI002365E853|nr:Ger(x)C family spore germination protein [Clostridium sp. 'White wine YQ']MDD7795935.1 Ger(x)C family spore germination protein [Clostridium sp. 'White wine YQ']
MRYKKVLSLLFTFLMMSNFLVSCWDKKELDHLLIVSAIALDTNKDGTITLTLLSSIPRQTTNKSETPGGQSNTILVSAEGEDIIDAYRKIEKKLSREIFLSQTECVIVGESTATSGLSDILDFFSRDQQVPLKTYILFSKGKASDILEIKSPIENNPFEEISKLEDLNLSLKLRYKDILYSMTEEGVEAIAPVIQRISSVDYSSPNNKALLSVPGSAVFKEDKLAGFITDRDTRGILWLRNEIKNGMITAKVPNEKGGGLISGRIERAKTKIEPILKDDNIEFIVNISAEATIYESSSKLDLSSHYAIQYAQEMYAKAINEMIYESLDKVQKQYKLDVIGFGAIVHGKYPKQWDAVFKDNWNNEFSKSKIIINTKVKIFSTGFDSKSILKKEEELIK